VLVVGCVWQNASDNCRLFVRGAAKFWIVGERLF